jgi:hypothetical protein
VCRRFIELCRELKLFSQAVVAVDGSKFKAVNARDRNFTPGKVQKRQEQIEESIKRYLDALDTADRTQPPAEFQGKSEHLQDKLRTMREQMRRMQGIEQQLKHEPDGQLSLTDRDARSMATSGRGSGIGISFASLRKFWAAAASKSDWLCPLQALKAAPV